MQLLFLGTGSGRTSLTRGHTSLLLTNEGQNTLIDCGEGISKSLLLNNISFNEIDSVVISHLHADHAAGLPSLLTQMKLTGRNRKLNVFIYSGLIEALRSMLGSFFIFNEGLSFELNIAGFEFGIPININNELTLKGVKNSHLYNKYGIEYIESDIFTSASFLFSIPTRCFLYSADVGSGDDLFLFDEKIDFIIAETTHITPEKYLRALVKYEPEKILLTHIDDEKKLEHWFNGIDKKIRKYFVITGDGMRFDI